MHDPSTKALADAPDTGGIGDLLMRQWMALVEVSQQGYALYDGDDCLRYANAAFRSALGVGEGEFLPWEELMRKSYRSSIGTVVETSDFEVWLRSARSRRGKLPYRTIETSLNDGRWVLTTETTLPGGWMLCVVTDVSELGIGLRELRQERDKAMKSALSDELTGLSNRRYAMDFLHQKLGPNKAQAMAVAVIDIDHFKAVNDRFGHAGGDLVLKDFSARLAEAAGRDDMVARIGGEEFLLVLQGARTLGADSVLRCLGASLDTVSPLPEAPEFRYSCSAGVALVRPGETVGEVLRRADEALYQAKRAGRNRVVVHEESQPAGDGHPCAGNAA